MSKNKKKNATIILLSILILGISLWNYPNIFKFRNNFSIDDLRYLHFDKIEDKGLLRINSLQKLLLLNPNNLKATYNLGSIYLERKEFSLAEKHFKKLKELIEAQGIENKSEYYYPTLIKLSQVYLEKKDLLTALELLEVARNLFPENPITYDQKGNIYQRESLFDKSRNEYQKAIQNDPTYLEAYKNFANQKLFNNKAREGLKILETAATNNPTEHSAFINLGDFYSKLGQSQKALVSYQHALDILNNKPLKEKESNKKYRSNTLYKLGRVYSKINKRNEAFDFFERALLLDPENPQINEAIGEIFYKNKNFEKTLKHYKKSLENNYLNKDLQNRYNNLYQHVLSTLEKNINKNKNTLSNIKLNETIKEKRLSQPLLDLETNEIPNDDIDLPAEDYQVSTKTKGIHKKLKSNQSLNFQNSAVIKDISKKHDNLKKKAALIQEGISFLKLKKFEKAEKLFINLTQEFKDDGNINYYLARSQDFQEKNDPAIDNYQKAVRKGIKTEKNYYNLGILLYKKKKFRKAAYNFNQASLLNPRHEKAIYSAGLSYQQMKNYSKAIKKYETVLKLNPLLFEAHYNMGLVYKDLKQYTNALNNLIVAKDLNSNDSELLFQIGKIYELLNTNSSAVEYYQKSLEHNHLHYEARFNLALLYGEQKKYEKAIIEWKQVLENYKDDYQAYYQLGLIYSILNDTDNAINSYKNAIVKNSNYYKAYLNLGHVYAKENNFFESKLAYLSAEKINPNSFQAIESLGSLLIKRKNYKEAIPYLTRALKINPKSIDLLIGLGESYEKMDIINKAEEFYLKAKNIESNTPIVLEKLAILYYRKLNNKEKAKKYFQKLVSQFPNHANNKEFLIILKSL